MEAIPFGLAATIGVALSGVITVLWAKLSSQSAKWAKLVREKEAACEVRLKEKEEEIRRKDERIEKLEAAWREDLKELGDQIRRAASQVDLRGGNGDG